MATMQSQHRSIDELAECVYRCLSGEHDETAIAAFYSAVPEDQEGDRTIHELDFADFGIAVGAAYGIARAEDAFEPPESVAVRAAAAATIAFERWGHWDISYEQDRAARPMPIIYPGTAHRDRPTPWEPVEDVARALENIEPLLGDEDRERVHQMSDEVAHMALRAFATGKEA